MERQHATTYKPPQSPTSPQPHQGISKQEPDEFVSDHEGRIELSWWLDMFGFLNPIEIVRTIKAYRPAPYEIDTDIHSIPLTQVKTWEDIFKIIDEIERKGKSILVERFGYTPQEAYRFITVMAELCQNIYDHSNRENFEGYIAMQVSDTSLKFIAVNIGTDLPTRLKKKRVLLK